MSKRAKKSSEEGYEPKKTEANDNEQESNELPDDELRKVFLGEKRQEGRW